ncbi:MAG: hypothetical protein IIY35_08260, partial [Ruminococcus sp.]|nr:hypothetical protein [Ruminococcus sp.]
MSGSYSGYDIREVSEKNAENPTEETKKNVAQFSVSLALSPNVSAYHPDEAVEENEEAAE